MSEAIEEYKTVSGFSSVVEDQEGWELINTLIQYRDDEEMRKALLGMFAGHIGCHGVDKQYYTDKFLDRLETKVEGEQHG